MTGITKQAQLAMLQSQAVGLGTSGSSRTLYIHLFKTTAGAGDEPFEDGTLPGTLSEVSGGGYAPVQLHSNDITFAAGPPTTASFPNGSGSGGASLGWTASGAAFGDCSAVAISTDSGAYVAANALFTGPIVDGSGNPIAPTINDTDSLAFTSTNPLIVRLGDPEPGTVPI